MNPVLKVTFHLFSLGWLKSNSLNEPIRRSPMQSSPEILRPFDEVYPPKQSTKGNVYGGGTSSS